VIQLHTFGEALIRVGEKDVRPSAPVLFAALLYLCVERGRRVPRTALQELLFPGSDERSGAHSLRQLLYKLRQLGAPLEVDAMSVLLPNGAVKAHGADGRAAGNGSAREVLPGYAPGFSEPFGNWLERFRAHHAAAARAELLSELKASRDSGDIARTSQIASGLLALDPLNEEATLALAESMALGGQKVEAVRMLEEYANEVGSTSALLRLPADLLRRRITDRLSVERAPVPLVGRSYELAALLANFSRASDGTPTMTILWGDAGIGKTRLVHEFTVQLALKDAVVAVAQCQPHDTHRPLGPLCDLVPKLLKSRGALGVSPDSFAELQALVGAGHQNAPLIESTVAAARVTTAITDLICSVAGESPLVLVLEDAQWLDTATNTFLHLLLAHDCRVHLVLTQRQAPHLSGLSKPTPNIFVRRLEVLSPAFATELLTLSLKYPQSLGEDILRQCTSLSGGNPLFICTLAEHLHNGVSLTPSTTIQDLLRQRLSLLSPEAALLLRFIVLLGVHGSPARLFRCTGIDGGSFFLALQELSERGFLLQYDDAIRCSHDVLADLVLAEMPRPFCVAAASQVAEILESDSAATGNTAQLWACAETWRLAGNRLRATAALRKCAHVAAQLGQPKAALEALYQAQLLADDALMPDLLAEAIRVADDAFDSHEVVANAERLRTYRAHKGLDPRGSSIAEFALVNLRRRSSLSVWDDSHILIRCALDRDACASDRIRAARVFLVVAEEQLERDAAIDLHKAVAEPLAMLRDTLHWYHYQLTYHGTFGELAAAATTARDLLRVSAADRSNSCVALSHASFALFRAGEVREALAIYENAVAETQRLSMDDLAIASYACQMSALARYAGDFDCSRHYHALSERLIERGGRPHTAPFLAGSIELSIIDGDARRARASFEQLCTHYQECFTPSRERISLGHDLLIHWIEGRPPSFEKVQRAHQLFRQSRDFSESDGLAFGLAITLHASGAGNEAQELVLDYLRFRRRDRYTLPPFLSDLASEAGIHLSSGPTEMR
jgi:DNA-binding SARP family transcriptional activator